MACKFIYTPKPHYQTIALQCLVVTTALMNFIDEGIALPYMKPRDSHDIFSWAYWIIQGNPWDLRHLQLSYEDRRFLQGVFRKDVPKPPRRYGRLFQEGRNDRSECWQKETAENLLAFFSKLQNECESAMVLIGE